MSQLFEWQDAWRRLHGTPDATLREQLLACYRKPHRKYHTLQHLGECLQNFRCLRDAAEHGAEIEIALWFHDAIYDTRRGDNEERSAAWAREALLAAGAASASADRVHALVMATRHNVNAHSVDAEILLDVDLWILGSPSARFAEYEQQVREEYAWVPEEHYRRGRRALLEQFRVRKHLFNTALFRDQYEAQARHNIDSALHALDT